MQPTVLNNSQPKRHLVLKIVISFIALLIVAGVAVLIFASVHQAQLENQVKTELIKQNKLLRSSAKASIYPATLPGGIATTDSVTIAVAMSGSGTAYCMTGTSKASEKIVYHMNASTPEDIPVKGNCADSATEPPSVPSNVAITSFGAGTVSLEWASSPFAAKYEIVCASDEQFTTKSKTVTSTQPRATVSELAAGIMYCRVAATNSRGQSLWSSTVTVQVAETSVAPKNVKVAIVSSSELKLTWSSVDRVKTYNVQYSTDIDFGKDVINVATINLELSAKGLKAGTNYYFHVQAITDAFDIQSAAFSSIVLGRTSV